MNLEELKVLIDDKGIFEFYDWMQSEEFEKILNDINVAKIKNVFFERISYTKDELILNPKLLDEQYSEIFEHFIKYVNIDDTLKLLKANIDINKVVLGSIRNCSFMDIEQLEAEDRELFIEKLGAYLHIDIQQQLMPSKNRETLVDEKKEVIAKLMEMNMDSDARFQILGMTEEEIIKVIEEFDDYNIEYLAGGMKEKNRVKIKKIQLGLEDLEGEEVIDIVKSLRASLGLKEVEDLDGDISTEGDLDDDISTEGDLEDLEDLRGISLEDLAEGMDEANRLKLIKLELTKDNPCINIEKISEGMSEETRKEVIKEGIKTSLIDGYAIAKLSEGMSEKNRKEVLIEGLKVIWIFDDVIIKLSEGMSEESKEEVLKEGIKRGHIGNDAIVKLSEGMSEKNRKEVLIEGLKVIWIFDDVIVKLSEGMSEESKEEVLKEGIKRRHIGNDPIAKILSELDEKARIKVIGDYAKDLTRKVKKDIIKELSPNGKIEAIKLSVKSLNVEDILELTGAESDEEKVKVLQEIKECLDNNVLGEFLVYFNFLNSDNEKYLREYLENKSFKTDNLEFSFKVLKLFGNKVFQPTNAQLTSNEAMEVIGEEIIYDLFKYYIFNGENIKIDKVLENSELFSKYEEFRKTFIEQKQMSVMNKKDAISEFNSNSDLIRDCIESELTPEEIQLLQGVLKEDKVELSSKKELRDFTEKRREVIENLIETNPEEAIIYMFTRMRADEYNEKVKQYINSEVLDTMIMDTDEMDSELGVIKAVNEFIELIKGMDKEKQQVILKLYNNDLADEFTEKGSVVADMRSCYEDIEIKIRKVYGKELSNALKNNKLPECEIDEIDKDVKVIKLQGEKFKLLIHGIDAYGKGNGKFEKREVGKSYICTSLISEKHIKRAEAGRYYGFGDVGENALIEESNHDMCSYADSQNSVEVTSRAGSKFLTTEKMIEESKRYNEIVLWREYIGNDGQEKEVLPSYIVCFNTINDGDREEAKRLGIPIVLIDEKAYEKTIEEKENKVAEKVETSEIEIPKEYTQAKVSVMDILRDASNHCSAHAEQEALQKVVMEMERQLGTKTMVH